MDILKEQINRSRELMGILYEQETTGTTTGGTQDESTLEEIVVYDETQEQVDGEGIQGLDEDGDINEQHIDAEALWQGETIPSPTTREGKDVLRKALHHLVEYIDERHGAPGNFHIFLCHSLNSAPESNTKRTIEEAGPEAQELKKFPWSLILLYMCSARDASKGNWKNGEYQWDYLDAKFPEFFGAEEVEGEVEAELEEGEAENVDLSQPNRFEKELR